MAVTWENYEFEFKIERYANDRPAVLIMNGWTRYGMLSTNMPDVRLEPDEFVVPVWNHSDELLKLILETGQFQDTGKLVFGDSWPGSAELTEAPIWRIVDST